jgi:hypothetical protein
MASETATPMKRRYQWRLLEQGSDRAVMDLLRGGVCREGRTALSDATSPTWHPPVGDPRRAEQPLLVRSVKEFSK